MLVLVVAEMVGSGGGGGDGGGGVVVRKKKKVRSQTSRQSQHPRRGKRFPPLQWADFGRCFFSFNLILSLNLEIWEVGVICEMKE